MTELNPQPQVSKDKQSSFVAKLESIPYLSLSMLSGFGYLGLYYVKPETPENQCQISRFSSMVCDIGELLPIMAVISFLFPVFAYLFLKDKE